MPEASDPRVAHLPMKRTCPFSPPPEYRRLREETPVTKVELPSGEAWAVTRHENVRQMLTDPAFSADRRNPAFPALGTARPGADGFTPSLAGMDPPEHGPARRAVLGEFTVKRMNALRPRIQQIVDECIDRMLAGPKPVDLVKALSLPVPSLVICELIGVPYSDHDFFQSRSTTLLSRNPDPQERKTAVDELRSYLHGLVTQKEADPTDDLLGRQVLKQHETGTKDHDGLVALAFLLLAAGHETTANMISLSTVAMLEHPEQHARITSDPGKTPDAVEELLRYFTIAETVTSRVAVDDTEIDGVTIRAGEGVLGLTYAANRDPRAFENPDAFDVERGGRHHLAFGFGAHQCLGQNLARMELQIVIDTLVARIPGLRLGAPVEDLAFKDDAIVYGLYELPVAW